MLPRRFWFTVPLDRSAKFECRQTSSSWEYLRSHQVKTECKHVTCQPQPDSGIRPQIAQTIVHLGINLLHITTKATLRDAFELALEQTGQSLAAIQPTQRRQP
jgi:hypothetical protein